MMTFVQFLCALRNYRADVLILGLAVTLVTALLKKTILKHLNGKLYFFLPFAVGIVFYAVYLMIATLSVSPLTETPADTIRGGIGCGCAATLYYIVYEQFFRRGNRTGSLAPLLRSLLPEETCEAASAELLSLVPNDEEQFLAEIAEILRRYADPATGDEELLAEARLIEALLRSVKT